MKISPAIQLAITKLLNFIKGKREDFPFEQQVFGDLILHSKYSKLEKYGLDFKMSTFLQMCRVLKIQPWVVMRFALEHDFDFTELDGKRWGE
jgi:hypothetical protein